MQLFKYVAAIILPLVVTAGCFEATPRTNVEPFAVESLDACLIVGVDLSSSFAEDFSDRAYPLLLEVMNKFFTASMGDNTRIVLSQISGSDDAMLFEGTPRELRRRFKTPEELSGYLLEHSEPSKSPVYVATGKTFAYVNTISGIAPETKLLTVIISDCQDSETDKKERSVTGYRMLSELKAYRAKGGTLAMYYVALDETKRWGKILNLAGFEPGQYVICNDLVETPELPMFD